ncbi:hypothetical protein QX233_23010, partial [Chryseobacterium gambrini]
THGRRRDCSRYATHYLACSAPSPYLMRSESTTRETDDDSSRDVRTPPPVRPFYELPSAVTPVTGTDVAVGIANHALGRGRR